MFITLLRFFSNKSGRGRPGLSRGECHSVWPFCTRLGLATSLAGQLPSRLIRHARCDDLVGRLTLICQLPPLRMRVDTVSYLHACVVSPPRWPYIRRHIGLSQAVRAWQSECDPWSVWQSTRPDLRVAYSLVLAETSTLDSAWRVVPFKSNPPSLSCLFINRPRPGKGVFAWTVVIVSSRRRHVPAYYRGRRNRLTN